MSLAEVERDFITDPDPQKQLPTEVRRRIPTVEKLVRLGTLKKRHQLAAERLYLAYVVGVEGAKEQEFESIPNIHIAPWIKAHANERRIMAIQEYRKAVEMIGDEKIADSVVLLAVHDCTLEEIADRARRDRRRVLGWLEAILGVLATEYNFD